MREHAQEAGLEGRDTGWFVESSGEGIVGLDADGRTTFVSRVAAELLGWDPQELVGRPMHELVHHSRPDGTAYQPERCPICAMFRDGRVHRIADEVFSIRGGRSLPVEYVSTPILHGRQPVGAVVVFRDAGGKRQAERVLGGERGGRAVAQGLLRAIEALSAAVTLEAVAAAVLGECLSAFGAQAASLILTDERGHVSFVRTTALEPRMGQELERMLGLGATNALADLLRAGRPLWVEPQAAPRQPRPPAGQRLPALEAAAAVLPLRVGRTIGGLALRFPGTEGVAEDDQPLIVALAEQCALALDRARLYERERHIAQTLQQVLLPERLPDVPGLELAGRYKAAGEGYDVGGDFYDVFETAAGQWYAVIGDVCGKGPEAAALTALARYTIRADAEYADRPRAVLARLNRAILRQGRDGRFLTAAMLSFQRAAGGASFTLTTAGHPPPLRVRLDGTVDPHASDGAILGVFADPGLGEVSGRLEPGETLVLYTDGVTEAGGGQGQFGEERLHGLLRDSAGLEAQALAERILRAVAEFQEGPARDDVTLLVMRAQRSAG
jgi:PAS domain S-box-containing protein